MASGGGSCEVAVFLGVSDLCEPFKKLNLVLLKVIKKKKKKRALLEYLFGIMFYFFSRVLRQIQVKDYLY